MARDPQDVYHIHYIRVHRDDPVAVNLLIYEDRNIQTAYRGALSKKFLNELVSKYPGLQPDAANIVGYVVAAGPTTAEVTLTISKMIVLNQTCYAVSPTELSAFELALFTETRHPPTFIGSTQTPESVRAGQTSQEKESP